MTKLAYGIDISEHNGDMDISKMAQLNTLFDFAIVRLSWGHFTRDKWAERNVNKLRTSGIDYGFYHYSYATSDNEAKLEVDSFLAFAKTLGGNTYPLVLDMEDADGWKKNQGVSLEQEIRTIRIWKQTIEGAGLHLMLYCNHDWYNRLSAIDSALITSLDQWHAHWHEEGSDIPCGIWQYTSDGEMAGHTGRLDMNIAYQDYPSFIKPCNAPEQPSEEVKPTYTNEQLAQQVIDGKWGDGQDRKDRLGASGYNYQAVQDIVNALLEDNSLQLAEGGNCKILFNALDVTGVTYSNWVYETQFKVFRILGDYVQFATSMDVSNVIGKTHISNVVPC